MAVRSTYKAPGLEVVYASAEFDLRLYQDFGLDLRYLEDPSREALMPALRRTATLYVGLGENAAADIKQDAETLLGRTHDRIQKAIEAARRQLDFTALKETHPAVLGYLERDEESRGDGAEERVRRLARILPRIPCVEIGLVSPVEAWMAPPEFVHEGESFLPVTLDNGMPYENPLDVSRKLTEARVGVWSRLADLWIT